MERMCDNADDKQGNTNVQSLNHVVVVLVCGLPGSGKTTLIKHLVEKISARSKQHSQTATVSCHHIEYDEIQSRILSEQHDLHKEKADDSLEAWRQSRLVALEELTEILRRIQNSKSSPAPIHVLLMDDNFHLRSMRKQVFQVCHKCKHEATANSHHMANVSGSSTYQSNLEVILATLWLDTPLEVCLERNASRPAEKRVLDGTIHRIKNSSEPPAAGYATWEVNMVSITGGADATDQGLEFVISLLFHNKGQSVQACMSPDDEIARLERERTVTQASRSHQLDQRSRQWVKAVAQIQPRDAKVANRIRRDILRHPQQESSVNNLPATFANRVFDESSVCWTNDDRERLLHELHKN